MECLEKALREKCQLRRLRLVRPEKVFEAFFCVLSAKLGDLEACQELYLDTKELVYARSLKFERRRASYLLGRYCGKVALGAYLKESDLTKICIKSGVFGQPVVSYLSSSHAQVGISHTHAFGAALAFSEEHPMGLDVELIDVNRNKTIAQTLTKHETELHQALGGDATSAYVMMWTMKESVSKALRTGITTPLKIFEIKEIQREGTFWISRLKHFTQYRIYSFIEEGRACSIAAPYKTEIEWQEI